MIFLALTSIFCDYLTKSHIFLDRYYYFNDNLPIVGKLLPLIIKDGIKAFKLKVYALDKNKFKDIDALFLEQYFLLDKKYNLNTLKIVNFGPQLGKFIFICAIKSYWNFCFSITNNITMYLKIYLQCSWFSVCLQFAFLAFFLLENIFLNYWYI